MGGATTGATNGFRSDGSGLISGGVVAPGIADMSCPLMEVCADAETAPAGAAAAFRSTTGSMPFMPASLWPGTEQLTSNCPGVLKVKSPETVWPGSADRVKPAPLTVMSCCTTPELVRLKVTF